MKGRTIEACSVLKGAWKAYTLPEGVESAVPVVANGIAALQLKGPAIPQVAVFDAKSGDWHTKDLRSPVRGSADPLVDSWRRAYYVLGRQVYAYSVKAQDWIVQEVEGDGVPQVQTDDEYLTVEQGERLYLYSDRTGRWTTVGINSD